MPESKYGQKGPTHGGDDDSSGGGGGEGEVQKINLTRYANKPDYNVRDLFWTIMRAYAANENTKDQLKNFYGERMSLLRVAISVVKFPERYLIEDIDTNLIAKYTLQLIFDSGWEDVFGMLVSDTYNRKDGISVEFLIAMKKIFEIPQYSEKFIEYAKGIIVESMDTEGMLAYIAELNELELTKAMKKELAILATEGIDQSQYYAIFAIAPLIKEDEQIKRSMAMLLRSWDDEARRIAATVLKDIKDNTIAETAKKQLITEENEEIKRLLEEIVRNNA